MAGMIGLGRREPERNSNEEGGSLSAPDGSCGNEACIFGYACLLKDNAEAVLKKCTVGKCRNAFHILCASTIALSGSPNSCGKHRRCRKGETGRSVLDILPDPGADTGHPVLPVADSIQTNVGTHANTRDGNRQAFHTLGSMDRCTNTQKTYAYRICRIVDFFKTQPEYPVLTSAQDNLILPLPFEGIEALFGHLARSGSIARPRKRKVGQEGAVEEAEEEADPSEVAMLFPEGSDVPTVSLSTLQGYKSALKFLYDLRGVPFNEKGLGVHGYSAWHVLRSCGI
uniref:Uncharacterized protein n=1 Tax=Hanusia phi TaxID=3032 RepID=A0A7S0E9E4_9CRYP|mmetsp:Transcript_18519/g.42232  ORF Transcript_18519/g.42232 Transcript_18519/m.42232 type:complete len:284 (+) Transcript_18519:100-951(+)